MTNANVSIDETFSDSNRLTSNDKERCSIDVERYVAQLEKRLLEQEQLISLLNQKIAGLESADGGGGSYANVLKAGTSGSSGGGERSSGGSGVEQRKSSSNVQGPSFVGSRKTTISSVPTIRYSQFFATRLSPSITADELANDLLKDVADLTSVKCCKLKTKHHSYSSFHVVVPEEQKQLVSCDAAWPEGAFVKEFSGRLLQSYVLESFDSSTNEFKSFSTSAAAGSDKGTSASTSNTKPKGKASQKGVTTGTKKASSVPKAGSSRVSTGAVDPAADASSSSSSSSPKVNLSPKNSRPVRTTTRLR
ncbi:hypothetical protein M8J77_014587 [Diaphorina citri]|nr:hypothetical protein M8J77_014587 [Diaphorina citri]